MQQFISIIEAGLNSDRLPEHVWSGETDVDKRAAAVLFPFYWKNNKPWVLLTQRNKDLKHHSGQVSFPGGAFEVDDKHVRNTALRETFEEVGIPSSEINLLGYLDSLPSISGFEVTPFVGFLSAGFEVVKDDREVHKVFGVPFSFFQNKENRQKQYVKTPMGRKHYYIYQYEDDVIWGLTAQIIVELVKRIEEKA